MIRGRHLAALAAALLSLSCNPAEPAAEHHEEAGAAVSAGARAGGSTAAPDIVLDGTDVFEFSTFSLKPLAAGSAGEYGAEQGGSLLTLKLTRAGGSWKVERTHQEPGEPQDRAVYTVKLSDGAMASSDGDVIVRGTKQGVLVLERKSETIPPDYWVHYLRKN